MNIQIFGTKKDFETKKAERYFKERGIRYQFIDMKEKGLSKGEFALAEVWGKGGDGGKELAEKVLQTLETKESHYHPIYSDELSIAEKIETICKEIYGAKSVVYEPAAKKQLARIESMGFGKFPVCMAKNQYSLSDDAKLLGRPENFDIHIREVYVNAGAGFVVALTGAIMTMPGLPKVPAANGIDVEDGKITGLF